MQTIERQLTRLGRLIQNQEAQDIIETTMSELKKRAKHIRIADRSSYGWKTVEEYKRDPLASSTEDEKRIKSAEKEAKEKAVMEAEKKKKKSVSGWRGSHRSTYGGGRMLGGRQFGYGSGSSYGRNFGREGGRDYGHSYRERSPRRGDDRTQQGPGGPQPGDICNTCGQRGHWSRECPQGRRGNRK